MAFGGFYFGEFTDKTVVFRHSGSLAVEILQNCSQNH